MGNAVFQQGADFAIAETTGIIGGGAGELAVRINIIYNIG